MSEAPAPSSFPRCRKYGDGFYYRQQKYVPHTKLPQSESAFFSFSREQKLIFLGLVTSLAGALFLDWHLTVVLLVAALTVFYFIDLIFSFVLIFRSFALDPQITISNERLQQANAVNHWPSYTILCPLYKEARVLRQFIAGISALDYPSNQLQVLLLLEENDEETIAEAQKSSLPENFEIVIVPHSLPKTKPKALNFGLRRATGEFLVIYDAEDIPEPAQLKKAILAFAVSPAETICIQAKLNFYNPRQNFLTKIFTAEYSLWFELILTGLQAFNAPIPLGGTSNHFRTRFLRMLHGWDAFNVTEDCDLGVRLAKKGFRTAIVDSITLEEANSRPGNWFRQRTRWIKGYIQTYIVHMRRPRDFLRNNHRADLGIFQLIIGGKTFTTLINPFLWLTTIAYFVFRPTLGHFIESFFPTPVYYLAIISLLAGNFIYLYSYMVGCLRRGHYDLVKYAFLVPTYWVAMSLASWKALYEVITQPHYWAKTVHGFHLNHHLVTYNASSAAKRPAGAPSYA